MRILQIARLAWAAVAALGCGFGADTVFSQPTPPFDTSSQAVAARTAFYSVPGRANLTAAGSPLQSGTRIDFFGDSITWLNGYVSNIQAAINTGLGTAGKGIVCINRGDDGGGVLQIRDGDGGGHGYGGASQQPFANLIASDHANIAVVFIGINDVWWRGTSPDIFRQGLTDIVTEGQSSDVTMVLATLAVNGEKPDGTNPGDATYDQFAQITREVAASTGTSLVDLRKAYIYYEMNNNASFPGRGPGGYTYSTTGILTYDGVHPTALGNNLLADQIAEGIFKALVPEPGTPGLLATICVGATLWRSKRSRLGACAVPV